MCLQERILHNAKGTTLYLRIYVSSSPNKEHNLYLYLYFLPFKPSICSLVDYSPDCIYNTTKRSDYRGRINVTGTGKPCHSWTNETDGVDPNVDKNYCRNPNNDTTPWCFFTESDTEYCNIPACSGPPGTDYLFLYFQV